jgi:hypothetical protein
MTQLGKVAPASTCACLHAPYFHAASLSHLERTPRQKLRSVACLLKASFNKHDFL